MDINQNLEFSFLKNYPKLPDRVKYCLGLYTKQNSDLFIDDLTSDELHQIANYQKLIEENEKI